MKYTYDLRDFSEAYLGNLRSIEELVGMSLSYPGITDDEPDVLFRKKDQPMEGRRDPVGLMRVFSDSEWELFEYARSLIDGFRKCKGMGKTGEYTQDDFWKGKAILEGIRAGLYAEN